MFFKIIFVAKTIFLLKEYGGTFFRRIVDFLVVMIQLFSICHEQPLHGVVGTSTSSCGACDAPPPRKWRIQSRRSCCSCPCRNCCDFANCKSSSMRPLMRLQPIPRTGYETRRRMTGEDMGVCGVADLRKKGLGSMFRPLSV